ncbi:hypothetical protein Goari_014578, partial [Gossypium aridum]|nr:hypothetical protein [Gossypium aridum]
MCGRLGHLWQRRPSVVRGHRAVPEPRCLKCKGASSTINNFDVGKAIGELVAIDWKDRNGGWTEFMRLKIKINVSCPLRRVVRLVGRDGAEIILAPHQNRAIWRNGIEMVATPTSLNDANDE